MIETHVKIHDKFSFEFKISFISDEAVTDDNEEFSVNVWLFIPNGLEINPDTYSKEDFYKDVSSNIRFITPNFSLSGIIADHNAQSPKNMLLSSMQKAMEKPEATKQSDRFVHDLKMFADICKSAIRDEVDRILSADNKNLEKECSRFTKEIEAIMSFYRNLHHKLSLKHFPNEWREYYLYGENFISNVIEQHLFRLISHIENQKNATEIRSTLLTLLRYEERERKKKKFPNLETDNPENNRLVVMQWGILKKIVESILHLHIESSRDGRLAEQLLYSFAAGVSMLFATVVTFTAQKHYAQFTLPLFLIIVVSYMFKDRIKELMRYYFNSQLGKKYFDRKRKLSTSDIEIGVIKESADYVSESKLPEKVTALRKRVPIVAAENKIYNEQIILYKKLLTLSVRKIASIKRYKYQGINDITRFHLFHLTEKMSDSSLQLYLPDKHEGYTCFDGEKIYPLHFIVRGESNRQVFYRKYRILFNRNGIEQLEEM